MNAFIKILLIFVSGGLGYGVLEIIWRRKTHWSMILAGGVCLTILYEIYSKHSSMSLVNRGLVGAAIITLVELVFGLIFNCGLKMEVWDYSKMRYNYKGQICLGYSVLWGILSVPVSFFCIYLNSFFVK